MVQRLEALERDNASLRQELAELRGSGTGPAEKFAPEFEGSVSTQPRLANPYFQADVIDTHQLKAHGDTGTEALDAPRPPWTTEARC